MSRVVVIGAYGHIGTYLVPRLVEAGHEVIAVSRGRAKPYVPHAAWAKVSPKIMDRVALENTGQFGPALAALKADVVIDLICFTVDSARQLVAALQGTVSHLIHIGTIWTHGYSTVVPTPEHAPKFPFGDYGIQKKLIKDFLLAEARRNGLPVTLIHPGHWKTLTFLAALRTCGVTAPWLLNGPINGESFLIYVRDVLLATLRQGDIVVMDNLGSHKAKSIRDLIRSVGAKLVFLPPYSPDLNPIEQFFSKLKHNLRKAKERTEDALNDRIGDIIRATSEIECTNYITNVGYGSV